MWLSQKLMAEPLNTFTSHELAPEAVVRKLRIGQQEVSRVVDFYNLDAIIPVGDALPWPA